MRRISSVTHFLAIALALGVTAASARAAEPAAPPPAASCVRGFDLMTDAEREAFRTQMHAAASPADRRTLMLTHHTQMQARAKERGVTLCGDGMGPGMMGQGQGKGMGMGPGPGPGATPGRSSDPK